MPGIADASVAQLKKRVERFNRKYVDQWDAWVKTAPKARPAQLKWTLGKWQACRPNRLRSAKYIEQLLHQARSHVRALRAFDISRPMSFTAKARNAILALWPLFEKLSYPPPKQPGGRKPPRGGRAGVVGISKAAMLVTDGRLGPAFDSKVREQLGVRTIRNADEWLCAIEKASRDVVCFMKKRKTTLQKASGRTLHSGRIYDMALGPKKK
jgi:hypothetical protein